MRDQFGRFARSSESAVSSPWAFMMAVLVVVVWACLGPVFGWSDTWQLVINTGTTIITFLMVFLIQHTQSRDTRALHLKIDELIRVGKARNILIAIEDRDEATLAEAKNQVQRISE